MTTKQQFNLVQFYSWSYFTTVYDGTIVSCVVKRAVKPLSFFYYSVPTDGNKKQQDAGQMLSTVPVNKYVLYTGTCQTTHSA